MDDVAIFTNVLTAAQILTLYHSGNKVSVPNSPLRVISAVWGTGDNFVDVTSRVEELMRPPSPEFFAHPDYLQADPKPGWNKALVIVYEFKGRRHIFTAGEHGEVNLARLMAQAKKDGPS